jgi:DNA-directed RNA polymerase specialized sigma24 family protein
VGAFDRFEPGTKFGAWAVSIAKIKVLEYLRQRKKTDVF